jgi:hypothetical protein
MSVQGVFGVLTLIVVLAIITTIVSRQNSALIINQLGAFFSTALRTAMGR